MKLITIIFIAISAIGCAGGAAMYTVRYNAPSERLEVLRSEAARMEAESAARSQREIEMQTRRREEEYKRLEIASVAAPVAVPSPVPPSPIRPPIAGDIAPVKGSPTPRPVNRPAATKEVNNQQEPDRSTVVGQLYEANAVFAIPGVANIKEEIRAQLIIDPVKTLEELKGLVTAGPVMAAESIKISRIAVAKLDAPDFHIISSTDAEQAVAEDSPTMWTWTLRPKAGGVYSVNIVVYAEVTIDSKTTKHRIRTFDRQVAVQVTADQAVGEWIGKYWQWITTTLILPFGIWLWKSKTGKKEK